MCIISWQITNIATSRWIFFIPSCDRDSRCFCDGCLCGRREREREREREGKGEREREGKGEEMREQKNRQKTDKKRQKYSFSSFSLLSPLLSLSFSLSSPPLLSPPPLYSHNTTTTTNNNKQQQQQLTELESLYVKHFLNRSVTPLSICKIDFAPSIFNSWLFLL